MNVQLPPPSCRVCLSTDVKLFYLHQTHRIEKNKRYQPGLADLLGFLVGSRITRWDGFPQHLCYYCCAQLIKVHQFRQKCQKTMKFLKDNAQAITNAYGNNFDIKEFSIPLIKTKSLIIDCVPKENNSNESKCDLDNKLDSSFNLNDADDDDNDDGHINSDNDEETIDNIERNVKAENIEQSDLFYEIEINAKEEYGEVSDTSPEVSDTSAKPSEAFDSEINENKDKSCSSEIPDGTVKKQIDKRKNVKSKQKTNKIATEKKKEVTYFEKFAKLYDHKVVCLSKEEQIMNVQERKDSIEYKESRFSCDICYKGFMSESAYKKHMKAHDSSTGAFVCDVCHTRYKSRPRLISHIFHIHKKKFVCNICDMVNYTSYRAKVHWRWHKGDKFECKVCSKKFNAHTTYLNHNRELHRPVPCADCGKTLLGTNELNKHRKTEHIAQPVCSKCKVVFDSAEALQRHLSDNQCSDNTLLLKPCAVCGENFYGRAGLREHMFKEHSNALYPCEQCNSTFLSARTLNQHYSNHHPLRLRANRVRGGKACQPGDLVVCELCAMGFSTLSKLRYHQFVKHSDERPHKCSECPKAYKIKYNLDCHMTVHTNERRFQCSHCSKAFRLQAHLTAHIRMHTQEKRFACKVCQEKFTRHCQMWVHHRTVHLGLPVSTKPRQRKKKN